MVDRMGQFRNRSENQKKLYLQFKIYKIIQCIVKVFFKWQINLQQIQMVLNSCWMN
ncbi:unnamed protein product [Paramecium sonneborni]|uniref:Uncharacterized protein n=1 Tax=Paramecium sonneborni TaxID=65129 RepID=A0A8S1RGE4_9CILI|nr:unnamed protein product [Paramecium sonneborni]